jgi:hypothetical protein
MITVVYVAIWSYAALKSDVRNANAPRRNRVMQDTSPAASQPRDERAPGPGADEQVPTWFDGCAEPPADLPLIALIPVPDLP